MVSVEQLRLTHARLLCIKALLTYDGEFYGQEISDDAILPTTVTYSNLKALTRAGYLTTRKEDPSERAEDSDSRRPLRRYYKVTSQSHQEALRRMLKLRGYDKDAQPA